MKPALVFSVAGTPRPQPRPRFLKGRVVSTADPKAKLWRLAVERACREAVKLSGRAAPLFDGAVRLHCAFSFAPPANAAERIGLLHTHKPDASNLLKLVEDVMESCGVFRNDSQVAEAVPVKRWAARAGLVVTVEDVTQDRAPAPSAASSAPPEWLRAGLGL